jgi:ABC-type branched-subunit amino acid transport system permease subunit
MARYPGVTIETSVVAIASDYPRVAAEWRMVIMGVVIIVATLLLPGGLVELPDTLLEYLRHRKQRSTAEPGARVEPAES